MKFLLSLYQLFLSPETGYDLPPQRRLVWSPELSAQHLAYDRQRELATEIDALPTIGLDSLVLDSFTAGRSQSPLVSVTNQPIPTILAVASSEQ